MNFNIIQEEYVPRLDIPELLPAVRDALDADAVGYRRAHVPDCKRCGAHHYYQPIYKLQAAIRLPPHSVPGVTNAPGDCPALTHYYQCPFTGELGFVGFALVVNSAQGMVRGVEEEIVAAAAKEIAYEIDKEVIKDLERMVTEEIDKEILAELEEQRARLAKSAVKEIDEQIMRDLDAYLKI